MIWYIVYSTVLLLILLYGISRLLKKNKKLSHEKSGLNLDLRDVESQRKEAVEKLEKTVALLEHTQMVIKRINNEVFNQVNDMKLEKVEANNG